MLGQLNLPGKAHTRQKFSGMAMGSQKLPHILDHNTSSLYSDFVEAKNDLLLWRSDGRIDREWSQRAQCLFDARLGKIKSKYAWRTYYEKILLKL